VYLIYQVGILLSEHVWRQCPVQIYTSYYRRRVDERRS
jgi:hypothetical protein